MLKPLLALRIKLFTLILVGAGWHGAAAQSLAQPEEPGLLGPNRARPVQASPRLGSAGPAVTTPRAAPQMRRPADQAASLINIHLASYYNEADAERGWAVLTAAHPGLLASYTSHLRTVELAQRGTFVRLLAGPLPGAEEAVQLCQAFEQEGVYCQLADENGALLRLEDVDR